MITRALSSCIPAARHLHLQVAALHLQLTSSFTSGDSDFHASWQKSYLLHASGLCMVLILAGECRLPIEIKIAWWAAYARLLLFSNRSCTMLGSTYIAVVSHYQLICVDVSSW